MKVLIPDDWQSDDWTCIRVQWPNSPQWLALLAGLLTTPTRGRWYDASSGSIKEAQEIGIEIFERNIPYSFCIDNGENTGDTGTAEVSTLLAGAGIAIWEDNMGQVVTDVQLVDGKLRVFFGHCCYEDLDIGSLVSISPGNLPNAEDEEEQIPDGLDWSSSACAKSIRVVYLMETFIDVLLDQVAVFANPILAHNAVREALPGIAFGDYQFAEAYTAALNIVALGAAAETENQTLYQEYRCRFAALLSPSSAGVTASEYSGLKDIVDAQVASYFSLSTHPTSFGYMRTIHRAALAAIGENDIRNQTAYLDATGNEDCSCPGASIVPSGMEWVAQYDFTGSSYSWNVQEGIWADGVGWQGTSNYWDGSRLNQLKSPTYSAAGPGTIRYVLIEWDAGTITSDPNDQGAGLNIEPSGTVIWSLAELKNLGSGTFETVGYWSYAAGDVRVEFDVSLADITASRITLKRMTLYGTGSPPVVEATLL